MGEKQKRKKVNKPQKPCIKCGKRMTRHRSKMCIPCQGLFPDEVPPSGFVPFNVRLRSYMDLRAKGWTQPRIAAEWGMTVHSVKQFVARARERGVVIPEGQLTKITEHGGGKSGISGCKCEPCVLKRREYMRGRSAVHREKKRAAKKASVAQG